jgi:hypothetical protein
MVGGSGLLKTEGFEGALSLFRLFVEGEVKRDMDGLTRNMY